MSAVTPGLVCAHHHLYSALARGMPPPPKVPTSFQEILEQVWWRLDAALDLEMIRWSAMLGALEALECGTTAIVDSTVPQRHRGHWDSSPSLPSRSPLAARLRSPTATRPTRPGLAETSASSGPGRAWASTPPSPAPTTRCAGRRWPRPGVGVLSTLRGSATPTRLAASPPSPATLLLAHGVPLPTDHALKARSCTTHSNLNNAVGTPIRPASAIPRPRTGTIGNVLDLPRLLLLHARRQVTCARHCLSWLRTLASFPEAGRTSTCVRPDGPVHVAFTPNHASPIVIGGEVVLEDGRRPKSTRRGPPRARSTGRLHARSRPGMADRFPSALDGALTVGCSRADRRTPSSIAPPAFFGPPDP